MGVSPGSTRGLTVAALLLAVVVTIGTFLGVALIGLVGLLLTGVLVALLTFARPPTAGPSVPDLQPAEPGPVATGPDPATQPSVAHGDRASTAVSAMDEATDLPTTRSFSASATALFASGEGNPAILVVQIDGFADVRMVVGDDRAEEVLHEVGRRIAEVAGDSPAGSLGGERFKVAMMARPFLPAHHVGRQMQTTIGEPLDVDGVSLRLRTTVGIALGDAGPATLTKRATIAVDNAFKANEPLLVHAMEDPGVARRRLEVLTGLSNAMDAPEEHGFHLEYQPIVDRDGVLVSAEALSRWDDPILGRISPTVFIPLSEQVGLVGPMFSLIFHNALKACKTWQDSGVKAGVSINVSPLNLRDPLFTSELTSRLEEVGLPASDITLEITESVVIDDSTSAIRRLRDLRKIGFGVALDDFGVGHSSLSRLRELPVTMVKLDKSFVDNLMTDRRTHGIIASTVEVCSLLDLIVVAEGVEHDAQADTLIGMGVQRLQGFLYSPSISVEEIASGPLVEEEEFLLSRQPGGPR